MKGLGIPSPTSFPKSCGKLFAHENQLDQLFYQSKEEMQSMNEGSLNNYLVIMTSLVGIGCLLVSYF